MASILFISLMNDSSWGESEELWYRTAMYASRNNHKVGCVFYNWPEKRDRVNKLEQAGCEVFFLPNKGRANRNIIHRIQYRISRKSLKNNLEKLPIQLYDKIVLNLGGLEILLPAVQDWYQKLTNYFILFHSHKEVEYLRHSELNILRNWVTQSTQNLFASEQIKIKIENRLNMHIENADTIISPIHLSKNMIAIETEKKPHYIFGMIAPLHIEMKAQDQLIKALATPKWMQRNWILNLYGEGKDHELLENLIERKGLTHKVFLMGSSLKVKEAIHECNVVLHTTRVDNLPTSVLQSLAMAKPIIVTNTGEMNKWVRSNVNGWIAGGGTADEIELALEMAWTERNRWEEMGKRSLELFRKQYPESPQQKLLDQIGIEIPANARNVYARAV